MNSVVETIQQYLDVPPNENMEVVEPNANKWFNYKFENLYYSIVLELNQKIVSISIDESSPFGKNSIFESNVYFETVYISTEPQFYGNQEILYFSSPTKQFPKFITLQIVKWPSGKLSIWQATPPSAT